MLNDNIYLDIKNGFGLDSNFNLSLYAGNNINIVDNNISIMPTHKIIYDVGKNLILKDNIV